MIIDLYKKGEYEKIFEELEKYAEQNKNKPAAEALHDILQIVKHYKQDSVTGDYLIGFYGKHIVSLFDNTSTMCCALLPHGLNRKAAIYYAYDPRIVLISYSFVDKIEKGNEMKVVREKGKVDGIVIAYIGLDKNNNPILIVDSVEGGRAFRKFIEKNYKLIKEDIERVAKEIGCKALIYNIRTFNETPRVFLSKIGNEKVSLRSLDIYMIGEKTENYLEAFGRWNIPEGKVGGYYYSLE
ncbi:MAG: hypothetical protein QXL82_02080 [Candidatus Aenigmatarchaeota archaeon]